MQIQTLHLRYVCSNISLQISMAINTIYAQHTIKYLSSKLVNQLSLWQSYRSTITMDGPSTNWRDDIFKGVEEIPRVGIPGNMVVLGTNAEPVLTGKTVKDVFMAAAQFGKGRIFVFGHDGYLQWFLDQNSRKKQNQSFCRNVLKWVTQNDYNSSWTIKTVNEEKDLTESTSQTVLLWPASKLYSASFTAKLAAKVEDGVGVIVGVTPWGFVQMTGIPIAKSPSYMLLKEMGIYLTMVWTSWEPNKMGAVVKNNMAQHAHFDRWLLSYFLDQNRDQTDKDMVKALHAVPEDSLDHILGEFLTDIDLCSLRPRPPSPQNYLTSSNERTELLLLSLLAFRTNLVQKLEGISCFPGDFEIQPELISSDIEIESHQLDTHATGTYAVAGCMLTVEILKGSTSSTWTVQVGCHTDNLQNKEELKRWPQLVIAKDIKADEPVHIRSPVGGLIYILSPNQSANATFRLRNVVRAPFFRSTDLPSIINWPKNSQNPGLWADFVGKYTHITLPSHTIRSFQDPNDVLLVLKFWDQVVLANYDLRGFDAQTSRRQWIVSDIQPSSEYMHSGYPIVTHLDAADINNSMCLMRHPSALSVSGYWRYFLEIGHNMQHDSWTFEGTSDVTNNIFTLYVMFIVFGIKPWNHPWLENQKNKMVSYLNGGANWSEWKNEPGVALGIYAQLARDFTFESYKKVFRQYEEECPSLNNREEKINKWVRVFSKVVKQNLLPLFRFWGFIFSSDIISELSKLPPYIPDDEIARAVPERLASIKQEFNIGDSQ